MKNVWLAKSINGRLDLGSDINKQRLQDDLRAHPNATYRIERAEAKRSLAQNNYFWLYLEVIERETGNSTHAVHEYVKKYLTPKKEESVRFLDGTEWIEHKIMVGKGTSELTKAEFGDVMDRLCSLTDVPLPDPTEAGYITNY
jgi:hypothetical protein